MYIALLIFLHITDRVGVSDLTPSIYHSRARGVFLSILHGWVIWSAISRQWCSKSRQPYETCACHNGAINAVFIQMRIHLKMRKAGQNIDEQLNIKLGHISQCAPSVYITHTDQMNTHALRHFSFLGGIIYKHKRVTQMLSHCCHELFKSGGEYRAISTGQDDLISKHWYFCVKFCGWCFVIKRSNWVLNSPDQIFSDQCLKLTEWIRG